MAGDGYASRGNFVCCASVDFPAMDLTHLDSSAAWATALKVMSASEVREFHAAYRANVEPYAGWKLGCGDLNAREKDGVDATNVFCKKWCEDKLADRGLMLVYRKGMRRLRGGGYISYHGFDLEYPADAPQATDMARN